MWKDVRKKIRSTQRSSTQRRKLYSRSMGGPLKVAMGAKKGEDKNVRKERDHIPKMLEGENLAKFGILRSGVMETGNVEKEGRETMP